LRAREARLRPRRPDPRGGGAALARGEVLLGSMIVTVVDLELARHQWAEGRRAVERARSDRAAYESLNRRVGVVTAERSRRVGQLSPHDGRAAGYAGGDRGPLEAVEDGLPDEGPSQVSTAADAAFDLYSRRASDYSP